MNSKHDISIILPAYNEEAIIERNVKILIEYLKTLNYKYNWDILIINDGSKDQTGKLADELSKRYPEVTVVHHFVNLNLGRALQTGFRHARGEGIIVMDLDLSYSVDHIEGMADTLFNAHADVVVASPYMPGGKCTAVPKKRLILSKIMNRVIKYAVPGKYYTFTGMVRAYRSEFIKNLNLRSINYQINPEIIFKAIIVRARIIEIPAHLDWSEQNNKKNKRKSKLNIAKNIYSGLMTCFIFRPYLYFMRGGLLVLIVSLYIIGWIFYHTITLMPELTIDTNYFDDKFSYALGIVFHNRPHAFLVGGFTFVLAILILGIGFISLQTKRYFDELFHLGSYNKSKE